MYEAKETTMDGIKVETTREQEDIDFTLGNSKFGIGVIMVMSALVGVWGSICLISGLMSSNNLYESLTKALLGM